MRRELLTLAMLGGAVALSQFCFDWDTRRKILDRDHHKCVRCGATSDLECAHINHDKSRKDYNSPSNGRVLCMGHHLQDHKQREGHNGLTRAGNRWSITMIEKRIRRAG